MYYSCSSQLIVTFTGAGVVNVELSALWSSSLTEGSFGIVVRRIRRH